MGAAPYQPPEKPPWSCVICYEEFFNQGKVDKYRFIPGSKVVCREQHHKGDCFLAIQEETERKWQEKLDWRESAGQDDGRGAGSGQTKKGPSGAGRRNGKLGVPASQKPRTALEKQQAEELRKLRNSTGVLNSDGDACTNSDEVAGAATSSGGPDTGELAEVEATIRNAQTDLDGAKARLAKEASPYHKRVLQQRIDEATAARKGHEKQAEVEKTRLQMVELAQQQAPKSAGEQLQALHQGVVAQVQEVSGNATDPTQLAAITQIAPAMAALTQMVGEIQAALAQVAAMGAATTATQTVAPAAPAPPQPQQPPAVVQQAATGAGEEGQVDQAKSACPAEGAGAQGEKTDGPKQAGTGTTCSPAKAAPKALPQTARKKPSEEYNLEALLHQAYEFQGEEQKGADSRAQQGGKENTASKRSRTSKEADDEANMSDGEESEQDPTC